MHEICGDEVASKVGEIWGLDKEGQLQRVWRPSGHDGLWFAMGMCEFFVWAHSFTVVLCGQVIWQFHAFTVSTWRRVSFLLGGVLH